MRISILTMVVALYGMSSTLLAQINWNPYSGNPIITATQFPAIDAPSVVFDGTTYHLWYSRNEKKIAYATSPDGITWTSVDTSVLAITGASTFDAFSIGQPSVIKDGDTLKMWYWGSNDKNRLGYAWSLNGISWTKVSGAGSKGSIYGNNMLAPAVLKDGAVYRMWITLFTQIVPGDYTQLSFRILYATSADGISWTGVSGTGTDGAVLDLGSTGAFDAGYVRTSTVMKTSAGFEMWYIGADKVFTDPTGSPKIGYATSPDGIAWTKVAGPGTGGSVLDGYWASVVKSHGQYKIWYMTGENVMSYATSGTVAVNDKPIANGRQLVRSHQTGKQQIVQSITGQKVRAADAQAGIYLVKDEAGQTLRKVMIVK